MLQADSLLSPGGCCLILSHSLPISRRVVLKLPSGDGTAENIPCDTSDVPHRATVLTPRPSLWGLPSLSLLALFFALLTPFS